MYNWLFILLYVITHGVIIYYICHSLQGVLVEHLGTRTNPWLLAVSIQPGSGSNHAHLLGNTTLPFTHGWVNFTGLVIDHSAIDFILDFTITYPETVSLAAVSSTAFRVSPRPYYAVFVTQPPGIVAVDEDFDIVIEIRDGITNEAAEHFSGKVSACVERHLTIK